jgi:hypothetical protein
MWIESLLIEEQEKLYEIALWLVDSIHLLDRPGGMLQLAKQDQ